jgi:hypothetical protein
LAWPGALADTFVHAFGLKTEIAASGVGRKHAGVECKPVSIASSPVDSVSTGDDDTDPELGAENTVFQTKKSCKKFHYRFRNHMFTTNSFNGDTLKKILLVNNNS